MDRDYWGTQEDYDERQYMYRDEAAHIREQFRLLWEQHVYWTRMAILGIAFASPDLAATTARLLRNATDFGRLFRRFYGKAVGDQIESLIREHLIVAGDLVKAAKAGNTKEAAAAEKRWYENADNIVRFLRRINPHWNIRQMRDMWYEHLTLTKREAVAILNSDYAASIVTFERIDEIGGLTM